MRRLTALVMGASVVFALAARPAAAAPSAPDIGNPSSIVRVPPDAVGLSLSQIVGTGLAVTLDSGGSEEHDLVLSNHTSDLRLTIKLTATDATGNLGTDAASWLAFGDDAIQLDPHAATVVPMTIAVPHDTQPENALAHVNATVDTAVAAADGSPVTGTASQTLPVSIVVRGTPTAQIAIADVHRVDQGAQHQLALVVRNFGDQGAHVDGTLRVAGDQPQTLPFHADLAASRDTTVDLDWHAPPVGTPSDIAVELDYGGGKTASWSSRLGGAPTDLSDNPPTDDSTPTTTAAVVDTASATAGPAKPWWKQPIVTICVILALLGAGLWFAMEMRSSRRRRGLAGQTSTYAPPGWAGPPGDESVDLAKQLVRLTEVVVQLVSVHREEVRADEDMHASDERTRARSPASAASDREDAGEARAGPPGADEGRPSGSGPPTLFDAPTEMQSEVECSALPASSVVARPEPDPTLPPPVPVAPPAEESSEESLERLAAMFLTSVPDDSSEDPPVESVDAIAPRVGDSSEDSLARGAAVFLMAAAEDSSEDSSEESPAVDDGNDADRELDPAECEVAESSSTVEPEPVALETTEPEPVVAPPDPFDPRAEMMQRLVALDRQRRRLREWMDAEEAGRALEPPFMGQIGADAGADMSDPPSGR
jgi:hypothetical protein